MKSPPPDVESDEAREEEETTGWIRRDSPVWLFSLIIHLVGLLILGLWTLSSKGPEDLGILISSTITDEPIIEEIIPEIEVDLTDEVEEEDPTPLEAPEIATEDMPDPGVLGDAPQLDDYAESTTGSLVGDATDWDVLGSGLGKDGTGKGGKGGANSFFGVKSHGQRFMFVVDNSNSMTEGRFEMAIEELTKSVYKLSPKQQFYIIFYSDTAYPLFYPHSVETWVKATPQNKQMVVSWLSTVQRCLHTEGTEALRRAFSMKPDVMYLLGDGAFTDKPIPEVLAIENDKIVVHTLGFNLKKGRKDFEAVAEKFRGKFHDVQVTPEMEKRSKETNRPRNRQRNGDWGTKLPDKDKKKKKK